MNIVVDGSNLAYPNVRGSRPSARRLTRIVEGVAQKLGVDLATEVVVFLDAGAYFHFERHEQDDLHRLESMLGPECLVPCKGRQPADEFVLKYAREQDALIISGDAYKNWRPLREGQLRLSPVLAGVAVMVPETLWVMALDPRDDVEQSVEAIVGASRGSTAPPQTPAPASPPTASHPVSPAARPDDAPPDGWRAAALDALTRSTLQQQGALLLSNLSMAIRKELGSNYEEAMVAAVGDIHAGHLKRYIASRPWLTTHRAASGDLIVSLSANTPDAAARLEAAIVDMVRSRPASLGAIGTNLPIYLGVTRAALDELFTEVVGGAKPGRLVRLIRRIPNLAIDTSAADPIVRLVAADG